VNGAVFLHIATIFYDNATPIAPQGGTWTYVNIPANDNITCYRSLRMNKG
jgi:hypothetical protein